MFIRPSQVGKTAYWTDLQSLSGYSPAYAALRYVPAPAKGFGRRTAGAMILAGY